MPPVTKLLSCLDFVHLMKSIAFSVFVCPFQPLLLQYVDIKLDKMGSCRKIMLDKVG